MSIAKSICNAIKIFTDTQKNKYDRTIQATIIGYKDDKDKALGKLKLKYQDTFIYAYVTDLSTVDSYIKGENVYVNIPNNDMSSEKTVIGLVKKLGDMALIDTDSLYYNQGASFYPEEKVVYTVNINTEEVEIVGENSTKAGQISRNFQSRGSQTFLMQADFYVNIDVDTQLPQYYGLKLEYSGNLNENELSGIASLSVDDVEGNPYKIGNKEKYVRQSVLITLPENETSYIQDFTVKSLKLVGNYFRSGDIVSIKNIVLQPVIVYNTQDTGLVLRISANKLKFDSDATNNDTITLKGILKKDGILQDLSGVDCYWFEYDGQTVQTGNNEVDEKSGFFEYGGAYWYCLNDRPKETDKDYEEYKSQKFKPARNTYTVKKSDFPVSSKKFKLVVSYGGQRVSHEITIENNKKDYQPEIIINNIEEDTYIGQLKKIETGELVESKVHWSLRTASGGLIQLTIDDDKKTQHEQEYSANTFMGKATLICDFFIESEKLNRDYWCGEAYYEITGKKALNSVFIENGEQVFLYENKSGNNSPIEDGARYPTVLKQLSATGYKNIDDSNTLVTDCDYYWFIPSTDTLLNLYDTQDQVQAQGIPSMVGEKLKEYIAFTENDWIIVKNRICNFTIAKQYGSHCRDNIYVVVYKENEEDPGKSFCEINRTDFTFAQEGESGTANTGVYCRIVPNALDGQYRPPYVAFSYNNSNTGDNRFIKPNYNVTGVSDDRSYSVPLKYFKIQVWKQGEKIFDGTQASSPVSVLSWGAYHNSERNLQIATVANATTGSYIFHKDESFEIGSGASTDRTDQWIYADVTYDNISYQCWLPFVLVYYATKDKMDNHLIMINKNIESLPLTIHYQEDGNGFMVADRRGTKTYTINFANSDSTDYFLQYSSKSSLLNYSFATSSNNGEIVKLSFTNYYNEDAYDFLTFKNNIGSGLIGVALPIRLSLSSANSMSLDSWNNEQEKASVQPDTGDIFAKRYVGGEKVNNQLNGIIAGQHNVSSNEKINGYMTYNKGHQTSFVNSEDGSASFGRSVLQQVVIKPTSKGGVIQAGTFDIKKNDSSVERKGMQINLSEPSMQFLNATDFSINKSGELTSKNWHITSDSFYKKANNIIRTGIGANTDITNETAVNIQNIRTWGNSNAVTAMAFWNQNGDKKYQSIITSDGTFRGKGLVITAGDNVSNRIPYVSSKSEGNTISNGLEIGAVSEKISDENKGVISLLSRRYSSQGVGDVDLVLNPYHFHFGDVSSFEINRNGDITSKNLTLKSAMELGQWTFDTSALYFTTNSKRQIDLNCGGIDGHVRVRSCEPGKEDTKYTLISPTNIIIAKDNISNALYSSKLSIDGLSINQKRGNLFLTYNGLNIPDVCTLDTSRAFFENDIVLQGRINGVRIRPDSNLIIEPNGGARVRCDDGSGLFLHSSVQVELSAAHYSGAVRCNSSGVHLQGDVTINGFSGLTTLIYYQDPNGNERSMEFNSGILVKDEAGHLNYV